MLWQQKQALKCQPKTDVKRGHIYDFLHQPVNSLYPSHPLSNLVVNIHRQVDRDKCLSSRNIQSKDSGIMGEACELDFPATGLWPLYSILLGGSSAPLELNISSLEDQILTGNQTHLAKNRVHREKPWLQRSSGLSLITFRQYVSDLSH